ncbi:glycerol-3-phosphate acyltransferase [Planococcus shixiaomingii]|uniref:glycerol-3-phosphate acyltransferase n=1 Tax=Planococcus shixiaomingii TaxID=3058393 RepID=UPI00263519BB|nr:glycerol-3-phosphate acyltransferase [Planococcus sp. N022]WKA54204.1 glycerol-3-phosphate acyltransferase [Planococcus sp. N022]
MILWTAIALITGYFIGCLHGSTVAQLFSGINIKNEGIKNSGASNAAIVLGWKYGVLVAFLDIFKGFIAVAGLRMLLESFGLSNELVWTLLFVIGAGVVFGHNFPFYMNFDGGKGTAAVIGVMLALDWKLGLAGGLLMVAAALTTGYLVIGVLLLYGMFLAIAFWPAESMWPIGMALLLCAMAVWKHLENIARIKNGTEPKVYSVFKKKPAGSS